MGHRNEKPDALSRDCNKNHHFYNRSLLRQKLALDTEDCFERGTKEETEKKQETLHQ